MIERLSHCVWTLAIVAVLATCESRCFGGTYWFYLTTSETVERPIVGAARVSWGTAADETVDGDVEFDLPMPAEPGTNHGPRCKIVGKNSVPGTGELSVHRLAQRKVPNPDYNPKWDMISQRTMDIEVAAGPKIIGGTLRKTLRGRQIIWEGEMTIADAKAFAQLVGAGQLRSHGLLPMPQHIGVRLIGFKELELRPYEGGFTSTGAVATWPKERDAEARAWLKQNNVASSREKWNSRVWTLDLPGFDQNLIVYRMLRSGIFDQVVRSGTEAGPGQAYSLLCAEAAVFTHPPSTAEAAADSLMLTRRFFGELASKERYRGVHFEEPTVFRTNRHRVTITGPSSKLNNGPDGYWDRYVLEVSYYKQVAQPPDEMAIDVTVVKSMRAKGPARAEPPLERFEQVDDSSNNLLSSFGTILGERVKATRQGLTVE